MDRNATNELAKQRNRLAGERTMTSAIQSCLTLIAFGFAFDRINAALRASRLPHAHISGRLAMDIGLFATGVGLLFLIAFTAIHFEQIAALDGRRPGMRATLALRVVVVAVVAFGLVAMLGTLIKTS